MIRTPDSSGFVDFNAGFGAIRPSPVPEADRRGIARRVPHFLVQEAATRATRSAWEREIEVDGQPHDVVAIDLPDAGSIRLTFSRNPALLRSAAFERPMPTLGEATIAWEWTGWKKDASSASFPRGTAFWSMERRSRKSPTLAIRRALPTCVPSSRCRKS